MIVIGFEEEVECGGGGGGGRFCVVNLPRAEDVAEIGGLPPPGLAGMETGGEAGLVGREFGGRPPPPGPVGSVTGGEMGVNVGGRMGGDIGGDPGAEVGAQVEIRANAAPDTKPTVA